MLNQQNKPLFNKVIDLWCDLMCIQLTVNLFTQVVRFFKKLTSFGDIEWGTEEEFID